MFFKIPRAYYYMNLFEPFRSIIGISLGEHRKTNKVKLFEEAYSQFYNHTKVITISHARVALYYCLRSYEFNEGDEVLMTPINIPDMVNMIRLSGLKERFVDIHKEDYSINLNDAKSKLTKRTKFLFVTHLNGIVPDMHKISSFAKENQLILIQDCTQNVGSKFDGKNIESYSELSFSALCDLKVIHTHIGGVIISENLKKMERIEELLEVELSPLSIRYFSRFLIEDTIALFILNRYTFSFFVSPLLSFLNKVLGVEKIESFTKGAGIQIGPVHIFKGLFGGGGNVLKKKMPKGMLYQYSDLQAKIGLKRLDTVNFFDEKRISNSYQLLNHLMVSQDGLVEPNINGSHVFWKFPIRTTRVRELQDYLIKRGIDSARSNLRCLNEYDCFDSTDKTPVASYLSKNSLYIPAYPNLSYKDMEYIITSVNSFFKMSS